MSYVFRIVLETSISAGIAALMVIAARFIIGARPGITLRLLFILLIIRLAVPVPVQSPLSVQNLFNASVSQYIPEALNASVPDEADSSGISGVQGDTKAAEADNILTADNISVNNSAGPADITSMSLADICALIWLCGVAAFSALLIFSNVRFMKMLRRNRGYDAPGFDALLTGCKNELGLKRRVETVRASGINTAAVYGVFRPKLLISPSFESLSEAEKRHVLLHEFSHIKRRDNLVCLLASILSIAYWFNPLIWIAFALMRKDIEVICDTVALKKVSERRAYAQTLLRLAESARAGKPRLVPALFISTDAIRRRIKMIVLNEKNSAFFTMIGLILIVVIAVCGCTAAVQPSQAPPESSPLISPDVSGSDTFTLKDGSISVKIPEGWEAKDLSKDDMLLGLILNEDHKNGIDIQSNVRGYDTTPHSIMKDTGFFVGEKDGEKEQGEEIYPKVIATTPLSVDGVDGKLSEITATVKYNNSELHGYFAAFVGSKKSYTISYLSEPKDFETYKDVVKSVITSAEFN